MSPWHGFLGVAPTGEVSAGQVPADSGEGDLQFAGQQLGPVAADALGLVAVDPDPERISPSGWASDDDRSGRFPPPSCPLEPDPSRVRPRRCRGR
jgi:hypothetical protein